MNLQDVTWICPLILKNFIIILRKSYAVSIKKAGKLTAPFSSLSLQKFWYSSSRSIVNSNFRHALNVVCFLLGNTPASEFYMPTFRNTLFHLHRQVGMKYDVSCSFLHIEVKYSWFQTFAVFWMLYAFYWVIPRRLKFICRRLGKLCSIFITR